MKDIVLDFEDYKVGLPVKYYEASNGIIIVNDKILAFQTKKGDIKLIGGSKKANENHVECLERRMLETTGYLLDETKLAFLCDVFEKKKIPDEEAISCLKIKLFVGQIKEKSYDESKKIDSKKPVLISIDEAIELNTKALANNPNSWVKRNLAILKAFKIMWRN